MEIQTYDTILTNLCDVFDAMIKPLKISRTNTNVIYLMFKAIAKGFEVINNTCVQLKNKFNPALCEDSDLESVAKLVGTEKYKGKSSGLVIRVHTKDSLAAGEIQAGTYIYHVSEDTYFTWDVDISTVIQPGQHKDFFALSNKTRAVRVQSQIDVNIETIRGGISPGLSVDVFDNIFYQGYPEETTLDFRKRILSDSTRQDALKELELSLINLPTVYSCKVLFNSSAEETVIDGQFKVPPYHVLLLVNGVPGIDFAETVLKHNIYPIANQDAGGMLFPHRIDYYSDVFIDGVYSVFYADFIQKAYKLKVSYTYDANLVTSSSIEAEVEKAFSSFRIPASTQRYVLEDTYYEVLSKLKIPSVTFVSINILTAEGTVVDYIKVPNSSIVVLSDIEYVSLPLDG